MIKRLKGMLAVMTVPAAAAAVLLAAQGAQASTPQCTAGAYAGYCGTQVNNTQLGVPALVMDSTHQSTALNNPVIAWTDSSTDPGTDWFQLPYGGNPANGVMFVFAPGGVISGMCAADPGNGRVVLRGCNGSNWQRWIATATDYTGYQTWTNRATHRILESQAKGAQLVTVPPPTTRTNGHQQWAFSH